METNMTSRFNIPQPKDQTSQKQVFYGAGSRRFNNSRFLPPKKKKSTVSKNGRLDTDPFGLTSKQREFVREYTKDYNGMQAVLRCKSFNVSSDESAAVRASQVLSSIKVQEAITAKEKDISTRYINDKAKVLKEMSILAHSDIADYLTPEGDIKITNLKDLPFQASKAIKKIRINRTRRVLVRKSIDGNPGDEIIDERIEFELYDKPGALIKMGQEIGIFKDKHEIDLNTPVKLLVEYTDKPVQQEGDTV
jgi:hypothetical protein